MILLENCPLKGYHTFHTDTYARLLADLDSVEDFKDLLSNVHFTSMKRVVLGGGSNVLFTGNYDGLVLKNSITGISVVKEDKDHIYVKAGAGEIWHNFVLFCIKNNYAGIENLSLIPGQVGAGPIQNIGAYGVELKDVMVELEALELSGLAMRTFSLGECKMGYRDSIFKHQAKDKYVISSVTFRLNKKPNFNTTYGAIEKELEKMGVKELSIAAVSQAVINIRQSKLPDPAKLGNAGSFFKNPLIPTSQFESLKNKFPGIVGFKGSESETKVAAGWLIEQCGWKGYRKGDAGVHKDQALVLVNYGTAKGEEMLKLSEEIMASVNDKFGIQLEREVNIIG